MFQVSLSTLLTPPMAPGAGLPAALSGAFSAALAGLATTPDGATAGKSAPGARQAPAEAGKSLPTGTVESSASPAPADDWLDPVAILASPPSARLIPPAIDAATPIPGPVPAPAADPTPKRDKPAPLPIANGAPLPADPIIISAAVAPLRSNGDGSATDRPAPASATHTGKKADDTAPAIDARAITVAPTIAIQQTPASAPAPSEEIVALRASPRPALAPIAVPPAPPSPPSEAGAPGTAVSTDSADPATVRATPIITSDEPPGDARAPRIAVAATAPLLSGEAKPAAADGPIAPVVVPAKGVSSPQRRRAESVATAVRKASAPFQSSTADPAAAVKMARRGNASTSTGDVAGRPVAPRSPDSATAAVSRASLQPPATPETSGVDKLPGIAATDPVVPRDAATPPPASVPARSPDAAGSDKAATAPPPPSHVTTADTTPAASPVAAGPLPPAAALPRLATLPAGMLFGIALDQRNTPADRPSPRDEALQALSAIAGAGPAAPIVMAAGGAQHGALDMRRDDWPQAMIDRIDALRDAADATNTRITLMPDALGKVDVSLRHDGDTVHVHFAADAAQTRAMLADAQPRLADAAQARGIRLGQTSVGSGSGEASRQPPRQPFAPMPARPVSTRPASADAASASSRLA